MTEQKKVDAAWLKSKFVDEATEYAANYAKLKKHNKLSIFITESVLWLKRLMIITGIYFYVAHLIKAGIDSKLVLFDMDESRYSIIKEGIVASEIKAKYDAQMAVKEGK